MQEQIFKAISIYDSKIEIRITDDVALIAIDDAAGGIITTDLTSCTNNQTALAYANDLCQKAISAGIMIDDKIY